MNIFKSRLKLVKGTRITSFLFIACSILIAAGILIAANMYYNIDTGEIVMNEIHRVNELIRAMNGLIVGGETLESGYSFQVVGLTRLATTTFATGTVELIAANQELRFYGGHASYYTGFQATTSLTTTTVYTLPGTYPPSTERYLTVNPTTGEMSWGFPEGTGTITAVGDVSGGRSFTSDLGTSYGTTLWFHPNASYLGALTIDSSLGANATYTLPAISGTNYLTLTATSTLANTGVLFADASGLIVQDGSFTYSDNRLQVGSNGIRFLGSTSGYIDLKAAATSDNTIYTWPSTVIGDRILTTDASGNLSWGTPSGAGGVEGGGVIGQVAFFDGTQNIAGDADFTWSTSTNRLTLGSTAGLVTPLIEYAGELMIQTTGSGNDIVLYPGSGIVQLATSTYIRTHGGYEMGREDTEILREMIPIFGFDLPSQTATTSYIQLSRTIEDYPFASAATGTTRVHKFVIRYADATTTASSSWRVYNETQSSVTDSFQVPASAGTDLGKGEAYITADVTIPTNTDDWRLDLQTSGDTVRVYQIFLAAYDKIQ